MKFRSVIRVAGISMGVMLLLAILAIAGLRYLLAKRLQDTAGIHESGYVAVGGQQQWIEIRGSDLANPVLLWLHGGPGSPVLSASYATFLPWERQFTLVHWHQRGAGLTLAAASNTNASPLTIDRMVDDGIEVAEYVRKRLGKDKIIVVGHSWGSLLGAHMAQRRPDLFSAYVGTGQFTNLEADGRDLYTQALAKATRESNHRAIEELQAVAALPPVDPHRMDVVRLWGRTEDVSDNPAMLYLGPLLSPGYPVRSVLTFERGFARTRAELFAQELRADLERDVPELEVAAFLFQGRNDWQVSTPSALRYFERLRAPSKQVVLFDGGHFVPFLLSDQFLQALTEKVRPHALGVAQ